MNFSKDIVLKSTVELAFSPTTLFSLKNAADICLAALSITCLQSCWGLHDALTNADACSDLRHPSIMQGKIALEKTL